MCDGHGMAATEAPSKRRYTTELPDELADRFEAVCERSLRTRPTELRLAVEAWVTRQEQDSSKEAKA
jgi:predicted transcriptional regulator